ncbi:MAG: hypothetical protein ACOCW1_03875 [Chitinispirillaceae bacterium]
MDISDLIENLESLFPVLIFAIWVIVTVLRRLVEGRTETEEAPAGSPAQKERRVSGSSSDELRRSLEDIFGLSEAEEELEEPQELFQKSRAHEEKPVETAYEKMRMEEESKYGAPSGSLPPVESEKSRFSETTALNSNELRKGIIWHELLQPPLALREETRGFL